MDQTHSHPPQARTSGRNRQMLRDIAIGHYVRNSESVVLARDLALMIHSRCCLKDRLICWDDFYLATARKFQLACRRALPPEHDPRRAEWDRMSIEDQLHLVLGKWEPPPMSVCSCATPDLTQTTATEFPNEGDLP